MRIPAFEAVGMLGRELPPGTGCHADHERYAELAVGHVPERCGRIDDLV
jgi:hypothetical protein